MIKARRGSYLFLEFGAPAFLGALFSDILLIGVCWFGVTRVGGSQHLFMTGFVLAVIVCVLDIGFLWTALPSPLRYVPLRLVRREQIGFLKYFGMIGFWGPVFAAALAAFFALHEEPWRNILGFHLSTVAGRVCTDAVYMIISGAAGCLDSGVISRLNERIKTVSQNSLFGSRLEETPDVSQALGEKSKNLPDILIRNKLLLALDEKKLSALVELTSDNVVRLAAFTSEQNRLLWDPNKRFPVKIEDGNMIFATACFLQIPWIDVNPGTPSHVRIGQPEINSAIIQKNGMNPYRPNPFSSPPKGRRIDLKD